MVADLAGIISSVKTTQLEPSSQPLAGVAISNLNDDRMSLIVSIATTVCAATSRISVDREADGEVVLAVEPTPEACDASSVSYTLQVDLTEPLEADAIVHRSSTTDAYRWGLFIGADRIPMGVMDGTRTTTAIRAVHVDDGPSDPPGIIAVRDAVNDVQLTWTADPCEDQFQLLISSKPSYTQMLLRATAIEVDRCGAERAAHAVVLSFAGAHPGRVEPVLVHGR